MAKASTRKKQGLGPPPSRKPAPVRSKGAPAARGVDRRWWVIGGIVAALVIAGAVLGIVLSTGGKSSAATSSSTQIDWSNIPGLQTGPPPWNSSSAVLADRLQLLKLNALGQEGTVIHIHQHLDVFVNGKKVSVPALIGIDSSAGFLTELHTHDASGVLHVESATNRNYVLGQLFGEWGVKLTPTCLGSYCTGVKWWVDGKRMTGNPAQLILKPHQEIVVAVGKQPFTIPSSYTFPAGE